jgi:hydroxymethylglutaryl-CoA reductase
MSLKKELKEMSLQSEHQSDSTASERTGASKSSGPIKGFSKLSKNEKIDFIINEYFKGEQEHRDLVKSFWHGNPILQKTLDEFSENTLTNFFLPFGVAPNVLIDDQLYTVPMVIEESSVVAAASKAAKFWMDRGGFHTEIKSTLKSGQVHISWKGDKDELEAFFQEVKPNLIAAVKPLMANMEKRGGGLHSLELKNCEDKDIGYFQLWAEFETCDAMGANFINSILEGLAKEMTSLIKANGVEKNEGDFEVIMAILSNYTPNCVVKVWVECPIDELADPNLGMEPEHFAKKFYQSVRIAEVEPFRATTHNKGVMNGVDAVILATGNDFRAVEACAHTYASRTGVYSSLTKCILEDDKFRFEIELPLSIGTVGGLTSLHPMARFSLNMLGNPNAKELMGIVATIGLAQNFGALRSLVTTGIQKGHMKMHLMNILNHLDASESEREKAKSHFENRVISFRDVSDYISQVRNYQ